MNDRALDSIMHDVRQTAVESLCMPTTRHIGRHCSYCSYKDLCAASIRGDDTDILKSRHFRIKTTPHQPTKGEKNERNE